MQPAIKYQHQHQSALGGYDISKLATLAVQFALKGTVCISGRNCLLDRTKLETRLRRYESWDSDTGNVKTVTKALSLFH
ncbi:hypothetical protein CDV31_009807 [Fusarium ambrosium]|uniref:Uncharacterized protein n=1 Tax=Fusarium ambrosium TaxID=131363 RepID=A0A428TS65_9HYPO|nr:hypothetical protein CDV31_009807 [Fusarium ambrosium]